MSLSRQGHALLHRGAALHGALPIMAGARVNLILWLRCQHITVLTSTNQIH